MPTRESAAATPNLKNKSPKIKTRARLWTTPAARDMLAAQNKGSEHKLGDWGFVVDASAQATPAAKNKPATP